MFTTTLTYAKISISNVSTSYAKSLISNVYYLRQNLYSHVDSHRRAELRVSVPRVKRLDKHSSPVRHTVAKPSNYQQVHVTQLVKDSGTLLTSPYHNIARTCCNSLKPGNLCRKANPVTHSSPLQDKHYRHESYTTA